MVHHALRAPCDRERDGLEHPAPHRSDGQCVGRSAERSKENKGIKKRAKKMKRYIIDYTRPDGRADFKTVTAENERHATEVFSNAGIDGWTGYNFNQYTITKIAER